MRLKDKVCIITGGGSGIGRAACLLFAREGARLSVADKRREAAEAVADECKAIGAKAIAIAADVSRSADARRLVEDTVRAFGRLDVLVNNAGYGIAGTVVETEEDDWDALMAVNVRGVYLCTKHAIPAMKANGGGTIVNGDLPTSLPLAAPAPFPSGRATGAAVLLLNRPMAYSTSLNRRPYAAFFTCLN